MQSTKAMHPSPFACPNDEAVRAPGPLSSVDPALMEALARAHRWKRVLDEDRYASISEPAAAEKTDRGYLGRILLLTLLAPDIAEAILDGRMPELSLPQLMQPFPTEWAAQRKAFGKHT